MVDTWPDIATSKDFQKRIDDARILVIGSGGIGCEVLKTLALTGFHKLDLIDMDTIETSNLNRQFLFRRLHVGRSKSEVAAEAVKKFCPRAQITAHQANIKDSTFDVDFFKGFDIIMNGLDNLDARRHVNRMALAANVPLIESGTTGYKGQVTVHVKGKTRCYECVDKAPQKSYPICTIRNTPDKPIHCIVWAKELLFPRLFGKQDQITDLDETEDGANEAGPSREHQEGDPSAFIKRDDENCIEYAQRIFKRVFNEDVIRVRKIENLWTTRNPPDPLRLSDIISNLCGKPSHTKKEDLLKDADGQNGGHARGDNGQFTKGINRRIAANLSHHKVWSLAENARVFLNSIESFLFTRQDDLGAAVFDKDDDLAVEFVTSAANLRALCYGIPAQTLFDAKGMAGNIIHAIATTNAIVSGLMVIEGMKVLSGQLDELRETFIGESVSTKRGGSTKRELLLKGGIAEEPKRQCVVCGTSKLLLKIDTNKTTLKDMINKVLKGDLSLNAPMIVCGGLWYEEGEDLEQDLVEENMALLPYPMVKLPGGGLKNGSIMEVQDQLQNFKVEIIISHQETIDLEEHPKGYILEGEVPETKPETQSTSIQRDDVNPTDLACSSDDILYISDEEADVEGHKRKRDSDEDEVVLLDIMGDDDDAKQGVAKDHLKRRRLHSNQ